MAEELSTELKSKFERLAKDLGWPSDIIEQIAISVSDDPSGSIDYPSDIEDQVFNLEYGMYPNAPKPAIRKFKKESGDGVARAAIEPVLDDAFKGVLF